MARRPVTDITAIPYVAHCARHQISSRAQNAHATSVVGTACIVRRALCATSNISPCAKCARYICGWYRHHRTSRLWRDNKYRSVRKMRTLRRWLIPPPSYVAPLARHQISSRAQNAHATSVVDTATIVRRAFGATSNIDRAQNAHADFIFAPKNAQY